MTAAVFAIARGRIGLRTHGQEHEGHISFEQGLTEAMEVFIDAQASRDPFLMLLAETVYVGQELASSRPEETEGHASCESAMQSFDDAFLALEAVADIPGYRTAEKTYPHHIKYRYKNMPKDAFHFAYMSHRTRVRNTLRKIGFDPVEQGLAELRMSVFNTAQEVYLEKQQTALAAEG
jgi:hypothetical protein